MKINKNIVKMIVGVLLFTGLTSCNETGYEDYKQTVDSRPALAMSGEWYINIYDEADGSLLVENARHKTYDSNDGQLWISDFFGTQGDYSNPADFSGWWLLGKVNYNPANLTFSNASLANVADGSVVNLVDGKILKNAALSTDGNVTDSIYFKATFDYAPTQVLIFSGHRRTGFLEDEH